MKPSEAAEDLGISRNAVYQHITSLKRAGVLDGNGPPTQESDVLGSLVDVVKRAEARVAEIRKHETELKTERDQLEAFIKRNRDLVQV